MDSGATVNQPVTAHLGDRAWPEILDGVPRRRILGTRLPKRNETMLDCLVRRSC